LTIKANLKTDANITNTKIIKWIRNTNIFARNPPPKGTLAMNNISA